MILPILRWPDPRLSRPCAPAGPSDGLRDLAGDMLETMYAASGRGLAAPQVGRMLRLFVMDTGWKEGTRAPMVMVNPEIVARSEMIVAGPEGCLSIPGPAVTVERAAEILLRWSDLDGVPRQDWLTGFAAICAQHECDHLDGVLVLDRLPAAARAVALAAAEAAP